MCFSETQSYINFALLLFSGILKIKEWRLSIPLIFLSVKDLIQGFLYKYINNSKLLNFYTILSWVHISFQPLFVNIFGSYFDINFNKDNGEKSKKIKFWNYVWLINLIFGIFMLFTLKDINKLENDCVGPPENNFCKKETKSYLGKYHIGYQFNLNNNKYLLEVFYPLLYIIPGLFTKAYLIYILWFIFIFIINIFGNKFLIRGGEFAAMWCFLSIIFVLPIALFSKQVLKFMRNIDKHIKILFNLN